MRGGIQKIIWENGMRRFDEVAFIAVLTTFVLLTAELGRAREKNTDENCCPTTPVEQSIVVVTDRAGWDEGAITVATDQRDDSLKPIARVSRSVPDLAEETVQQGRGPDLANPSAVKVGAAEGDADPVFAESNSQVIKFEGITPGISHRRDVFRAWGDPRSESTAAKTLRYRFDQFQSVSVGFDGEIVDTMVVRLDAPIPLSALMHRLKLEGIRPAALTNDQGVLQARAFPERGVVLHFSAEQAEGSVDDTSTLHVGEIVIQPIKAEPFVLRAENGLSLQPSQSHADLEAALQLNPKYAHALWLMAELEMKRGKAVAAERYAAEASELEPENLAFRLQWAKCLRQLARYDRAVAETKTVLEVATAESLLRAEALFEMGMLAALGSQEVAKSAVPLHQKAMEIADALAGGDDLQISRAANRLLVEAHLATAVEIARGQWKQKMETVPKWIERASALAEGIIAEDTTQLHFRLKVAVSALAAVASLDQPIDPQLWIEEVEQTSRELRRASDDPISRDQIDWNVGLAYFQAAQIEHRRREPESALRFGKLADAKLLGLAKDRDELPDTAYLMGRLYFQIGAVYAVHENDHATACEWYEQAHERLLNPVPVTTMASPQQHGDALVSMGFSYWENDNREQAIKVTRAGVELIEQAVTTGLLTSETLAIPYGNLAAMYEAHGETKPAARYAELARKLTSAPR